VIGAGLMAQTFNSAAEHFKATMGDMIAAGRAGLTSGQHQALLAINGFLRDDSPTVGDLGERLRIQHRSAVELVDRLAEAGLIMRTHDPHDRRRALLKLTRAAEELLASLSALRLQELHVLRPALLEILNRVGAPPEGQPTPIAQW
jgi:DNA-binding MarR family transcriptional regulator